MAKKQKSELIWVEKDERIKLPPHVLVGRLAWHEYQLYSGKKNVRSKNAFNSIFSFCLWGIKATGILQRRKPLVQNPPISFFHLLSDVGLQIPAGGK